MSTRFSQYFTLLQDEFDNPDYQPLRGELFNLERLEQYAQSLAQDHTIVSRKGRAHLLPRLEDNARKLLSDYRTLVREIGRGHAVSPAGEWLVENFPLVEEQIREIRRDLPPGYYHKLPKLARGDLKYYPRIYGIALSLIAHTDCLLDAKTLRRFVASYQTVSPLTIGELWGIAIMLRLALLENLRRLTSLVMQAREEREQADKFANRLLELAQRRPSDLLTLVRERLGKREKLPQSFLVQLTQRLREQDPAVAAVMGWLENYLARHATTLEQIIHVEHQRQAATPVTVANIITSLRLLTTLNWHDFFESVSLIEPLLANDPAGAYAKMEFESRDRYRDVVERISRRSRSDEFSVARAAVRLAELGAKNGEASPAESHVGYYLLDSGAALLEAQFAYRPTLKETLLRFLLRHATGAYLGTTSFLTLVVLALVLFAAYRAGASWPLLLLISLLTLIPASNVAISLLNWDLMHLLHWRVPPRMQTSDGIPQEASTMVVVPSILFSESQVSQLVEDLEVQFLANQDEHIYFALLSDFPDAEMPEMPDDSVVLEAAIKGIAALNRQHAIDNRPRFHLFHRRRHWTANEQKWIGWERKRGKLEEFNRLARGARDTSFTVSTANDALLSQIRYVITLDGNTHLPRDAARKLIGDALHPLNRPTWDATVQRITYGYGIIQPRIHSSLVSGCRSLFANIFSGITGSDLYTSAGSDVYHNLWGEGTFTGQGLYEIDTFQAALSSRIPENRGLSHGELESIFTRTALAADIEFIDNYPSSYDAYALRQHRRTRAEWQIFAWLRSTVVDAAGKKARRTVSTISRWKILDNLRRSLIAPTFLLWLLAAWTVFPGSPSIWTLAAVGAIALPIFFQTRTSLLIHRRGGSWISHIRSNWSNLRTNAAQVALSIVFLPHQAYLMADAIVRTIFRALSSEKRLLEWLTADETQKTAQRSLSSFIRFMWAAELLAALTIVITLTFRPSALPVVLAFAAAWASSPAVAYWISRPLTSERTPIAAKDVAFAREIARRTWRFFETFVTAEDNWLPPNNFQEDPSPVIAHRTSPTDIGLLLLSTLAAYDFGYLSTAEFIDRQESTFATLHKLERFRGHFLNWYDTRTLQALTPKYISTVDSGNLAAYLIALKQACAEMQEMPVLDKRIFLGIKDTLQALYAAATRLPGLQYRNVMFTEKQLQHEIDACMSATEVLPESISSWSILLESLAHHTSVIEDISKALSQDKETEDSKELEWWISALREQVNSHLAEIKKLRPWEASSITTLEGAFERESAQVQAQWNTVTSLIESSFTLSGISEAYQSALTQLTDMRTNRSQSGPADFDVEQVALENVSNGLDLGARAAADLISRLNRLARSCDSFVAGMDFQFLFDQERKVFSVGYYIADSRFDESYYEFLASDSRLASFIAIAKGDVRQDHWSCMRRQLTSVSGGRALISWSGSMFEYLMPLLVMRSYDKSLLARTYRTVVQRQIEYGGERGVPWGISEAAYNVRDIALNYQYGPFGVPGLGMKHGLIGDLVVAPYATALATAVNPQAAVQNLRRLEEESTLGKFGYYDSIDYTPARVPQNEKRVLIRTYVAHHQGINLVALDNAMHDRPMEKRFHADPMVRATELLLQERILPGVPSVHPRPEVVVGSMAQTAPGTTARIFHTVNLERPRTQLLSNGTYTAMITTAGAGYSQCGNYAITRWLEDATRDDCGTFIYLRDVRDGPTWSATHQPLSRQPQAYEVVFSEDRVEFWRTDVGIVTHTEVIVSAEDNAEIRRVSITNNSARVREIELTSYLELLLSASKRDELHRSFDNLSIETEFVAANQALIARRRPFADKEEQIWMAHVTSSEADTVGELQFETDRTNFIGRGRTTNEPILVVQDRPLSNSAGLTLDPCLSLRRRIRLRANETARVSFVVAIADSRAEVLRLADKYRDPLTFDRETSLAWTKAQVELSHLRIDADEAHLFQQLAARIIFVDRSLRPRPHVLALNTKNQSALKGYGISGDLPLVLVRISKTDDLPVVRQLLRAHEYLNYKGLHCDVVILSDEPSGPGSLLDDLELLARASSLHGTQERAGSVSIISADSMPEAERIFLHVIARVVIVAERGSLEDQLDRPQMEEPLPPAFVPRQPSQTDVEQPVVAPDLKFFNGLGGFHQGGREYVTTLGAEQWTPAPWANVIGNRKDFGFQVTETGAGFTWAVNSRENRLTPWSNDAASDPPGEIVYLRDEDTGTVWSITPLPIRENEPYLIRHGQGYSVFEHTSHGISQEMLLFTPLDEPVKITLVRLRNRTDRKRKLTVTLYNELVLGQSRSDSAPYLITEIDQESGTIFARNPLNNEYAHRVAFAAASEKISSATCDRKEFIGRNGALAQPAALRRVQLAGRSGAGLDPCAALQITIELGRHEAREVIFLLGQAETKAGAQSLVQTFTSAPKVNDAFEEVLTYWDRVLGTIEVKTPDAGIDMMLNRWLIYQTLSCRIWSRSAFYQSDGALNFRDLLQDVMALVYSSPALAREQILTASRHQFIEGDVQHWWHPPTGRGLRTRCSDDLLWLPFATAFYIKVTGDYSIFDEKEQLLEQPLLSQDQQQAYLQPKVSEESVSVFEHCARAIDRSLKFGTNGLPLMGTGDWNDGMNRVGHMQKGESIWVGWFLYMVLEEFTPFCEARSENIREQRYREHCHKLKQALTDRGWDGDWHRRAYFDDGTPLGSAQNDECRIESSVQSWSVISGGTQPYRASRAMQAVDEYLVNRREGVVTLFTPPFGRSKLDPGYIRNSMPGARENGGQNTKAAIWAVIAFAMLGDGERATELMALLNPINHTSTRAGLNKYKVEPYVTVSDVFTSTDHIGRGYRTWNSDSAAWMYRAVLEYILGFKLRGDRLTIAPCIARAWQEYQITYRYRTTTYRITVENPLGISGHVALIELDSVPLDLEFIPLKDDGGIHVIRVVLGKKAADVDSGVVEVPEPLPTPDLFVDDILEVLRVSSLLELVETADPLHELSARVGLSDEFKGALQNFDRAAQFARQLGVMRTFYSKADALNNALAEIDSLQDRARYMRDGSSPAIQKLAADWREVLSTQLNTVQAEGIPYVLNPFVFGQPIVDTDSSGGYIFTGRKDIIEEIETDILGAKQPPTLLLHGPRRMGKTSILYQLPRLLGPKFLYAIIDFQRADNTESVDSLLYNICKAVSRSAQRQGLQIAPPPDLTGNPFATFNRWLESADEALKEDMRILLCFDEYEKLQEVIGLDWVKQFLNNLRSILQGELRIVIMFTGVKTLENLGPEWVSRFINTKAIRVSFLKLEEVRLLLEQPTPEFRNTYAPDTIEAIFAATNGQPFLTQAVGFELFNILRKEKRFEADLQDVNAAIEGAIDHGSPYFASIWSDAGDGGQAILSSLITHQPLPDSPAELELLIRNDVLDSNQEFLVPMVERWLQRKFR